MALIHRRDTNGESQQGTACGPRFPFMSKTRLVLTLGCLLIPLGITVAGDSAGKTGWDDLIEFLLAFFAAVTLVVVVAASRRHNRSVGGGSYALNKPDGLWLSLRRIAGSFVAFFFPDVGVCWRCYSSWAVVKPHITTLRNYQGHASATFFAICETCWKDATLEEKMMYYFARYAVLYSRGVRPSYRINQDNEPRNTDVEAICEALEHENDEKDAA